MDSLRLVPVFASIGLVLAGAPAAASAATPASAVTAESDVNDFSYASWDARYEVGLDDEGRSHMLVTETLTARFPETDQNRGIVRGVPTSYDNSRLDTRVLSVTDQDGDAVPYETDEDDGVLYVLTGDDDYVHGLTTYVIAYEMSDVMLAADTGVDEFYWDLLPLDSTQPIESFRADVVFDDALTARLTGESRCYTGVSGSTEECALSTSADGTTFHVERSGLAAGEGVTVAVGFEGGTVTQPAAREPDPVTDTVPAIAALGAAGLSVGSWFGVWAFRRERRRASGIVVAQYDVPDSMPPLLAAAIVPGARNAIPSEIVHLAVRGALRIEDGADDEQPRLRRLAGGRVADQLDAEALDALFSSTEAGDVAEIPAASETFAARMSGLTASGVSAASARGLVTKARSGVAIALQWSAIAVAVVGFGIGLFGVISGRISAIPAFVAIAFGLFLVLLSSFYGFSKHTVLTPDGARALEYLLGVKEFIRVAEADRLRMLQSYTGAERRQDGSADVIVVYERLLPYAMLFGMENEWGAVLERAYATAQRGANWIGDPTTPFVYGHLAAFAARSNDSATYTAPSANTSSSAGGSFGGGFSGGGGGGGFSGGR